MQFVLQVRQLRLVAMVVQRPQVSFEVDLLFSVLSIHHCQLTLLASCSLRELSFKVFELLSLLLDNFDLSIEDKLLAFDFERLLVQIVDLFVEVSLHLRILAFKQADMLVRCLVVIVQTANARLLLVLDDLLPENLQLKFHEVDLLLQVDDVFVCRVDIGVGAKLTRCKLLFLLTTEVHGRSAVVTRAATEGTSPSEIRSFP